MTHNRRAASMHRLLNNRSTHLHNSRCSRNIARSALALVALLSSLVVVTTDATDDLDDGDGGSNRRDSMSLKPASYACRAADALLRLS